MVNQILPYLGQLPYVLHRLDMNTSGGWRLALRFMTPYFVLPRFPLHRSCGASVIPETCTPWFFMSPGDVRRLCGNGASMQQWVCGRGGAQGCCCSARRCWRRGRFIASSASAQWAKRTWPSPQGCPPGPPSPWTPLSAATPPTSAVSAGRAGRPSQAARMFSSALHTCLVRGRRRIRSALRQVPFEP